MKNTFKLAGIAAVIAVIALFVGCTNPTDGDKDNDTTTYTVTFNINGGSGTVPSTQTLNDGSSVTLPSGSRLTRTGYTFGGWNTNASGTGTNYNAGSSYTVTGDVILYAKWNVNQAGTYTVNFNANGGSGITPAQTVSPGSSITLPSGSGLTRTDYTFGGWNTEADGTGTNYAAGSSFTPSGNITLYAKWNAGQVGTYTVTFNANGGGGGALTPRTVSPGSSITLPSGSILSKTGYTFGGWNTNEDGTGENFSAGSSFTPSGDVTLYAKWDTGYIVTFDRNGGNGITPSAQTVSSTSSIFLPGGGWFSMASAATFIGWNTEADGTGTNYEAGASFTSYSDVTLYANWRVITYTITFNANGATSGPAPASRQVPTGSSTTIPDKGSLSLAYATFDGWNTNADGSGTHYAAGSSYTPTGNIAAITLYAQWVARPLSEITELKNKLTWLQAHAKSNESYTLEVNKTESISSNTLSYNNKSNITITLIGIGTNHTISYNSYGSLFTVGSGITLVLDNITLDGGNSNTASLVKVNSGGTLIMNDGSVITGNTNIYESGMSGSGYGGGVYVNSDGTFIMNGGTITGNTSSARIFTSASSNTSSYGGGVYVNGGTFTMNGGTISGNTSSSSASTYSDTSARSYSCGGGVYIGNSGTFTMNGGTISGNTTSSTASASGGGSVNYSFSYSYGGGVYVGEGTFTMSGGTISGNTSTGSSDAGQTSGSSSSYVFYGGGVYIGNNGTFDKTGGTIYGYSESDTVNSNVVKIRIAQSNVGHAVYAGGKRKETTAGPEVNLLFYGTGSSTSTWSGSWDN